MRYICCLVGLSLVLGCGDDTTSSESSGGSSGRGIGSTMPEPDSMVVVVDGADASIDASECEEGDRIACEDACGVKICTDGIFSEDCQTATELCNGIDDDCDESVDENYDANGLGFACQVVLENNCVAQGVNVCSDSAISVTCEAEAVEPADEVCDGLDNDCDDVIDEDFPDVLCCIETYQCPLGNLCNDGVCQKDDGTLNTGGSSGEDDCNNSDDCPFGQYCENGVCISSGGVCIEDNDCAAGNRCEDFICVPGVGTGACTYDFECEGNEVCEAGDCIPDSGFCYVDADCANGFECIGLTCVPESGVSGNTMVNFCGAAIAFGNSNQIEGSTTGGTDVTRPSCAFRESEAPDLVYRWRPTVSGEYTIDTNGSGFDTILAVFDNCSEVAMELDCDDDGGQSTRSQIVLTANANQTYYIVVSGSFSAAEGSVLLNVNSDSIVTPECTTSDDCNNGQQCISSQCEDVSEDGFCGATETVFTNVSTSGSTVGAANRVRPSCGLSSSESPDAIYSWRPTRDGEYVLSTMGSDFDTVLAVYDACGERSNQLGCNDDGGSGSTSELTVNVTAFNTYFVLVTGYKTQQSGDYTLNITEGGGSTPGCTLSSQCASNERCENGVCTLQPNAVGALCDHIRDDSIITSDYPAEVSGSLSDNFMDNCGETSGGDFDVVWYPIVSGTFKIKAESTSNSSVILGIYKGCSDDNGEQVECVDDWSALTYEETTITVDVDTVSEYRIVVSGQDQDEDGNVRIRITQE